jgi:DNA-binding response OmpR family regulator
MRCLFLPDELDAFRPVAEAFREQGIGLVVLRAPDARSLTRSVHRVLASVRFDAVIIGANAADSSALQFLRQWKLRNMPALGVTSAPSMCDELLAAGAFAAILLPQHASDLVAALRNGVDRLAAQESR